MNNKPTISIIAAIAENRAIGKDNKLLWHIPEDLMHFKNITNGHPVIMGQKTFESLPNVLPDRLNIVLSKESDYHPQGVKIARSINDAIDIASEKDKDEIFFIGGGNVYAQAMPLADKLYLTIVSGKYDADTFFPNYNEFKFVRETGSGQFGEIKYRFCEYKK